MISKYKIQPLPRAPSDPYEVGDVVILNKKPIYGASSTLNRICAKSKGEQHTIIEMFKRNSGLYYTLEGFESYTFMHERLILV